MYAREARGDRFPGLLKLRFTNVFGQGINPPNTEGYVYQPHLYTQYHFHELHHREKFIEKSQKRNQYNTIEKNLSYFYRLR